MSYKIIDKQVYDVNKYLIESTDDLTASLGSPGSTAVLPTENGITTYIKTLSNEWVEYSTSNSSTGTGDTTALDQISAIWRASY